MQTDYNKIAEEYRRAKHQPWRLHIEYYTFFQLIGDLKGKTVLDLACGEGFYTRLAKQHGAARAVGVDLSEKMIELARTQESERPLGIEYHVHDEKTLDLGERFDVVIAAYLLNYASTREELLDMCRGIARNLKPGCRFISVNNNPDEPAEHFASSRKYGFIKSVAGEVREGTPIDFTFFLEDGTFSITNYHLSKETHEWAFAAASISNVHWHAPQLSPQGEREFGRDFWATFLEQPPVIFIEAVNK